MLAETKTAIVTGGAGFVGSHLCDLLLTKKIKVICLDNLLTGSKNNIAHLISNKNFEFIEGDIIKEITIKEKVDWVFSSNPRVSRKIFLTIFNGSS